MVKAPKMNQQVYIVTCSGESLQILKGTVAGAFQVVGAYEKIRYLIDTPLGRYERFPMGMFASPKDIAESIDQYVIE